MPRPNTHLEVDVKDELAWDPCLNDSLIVVRATDGKVTLTGSVDRYAEWVLASEDAYSVRGVTSVDNQLVVGLVGAKAGDAVVASKCIAALDAERRVPRGSIQVDVVDGWATLSGEVRYQYQRTAARRAVEKVAGLIGVTDKIVIASDAVIPSDVVDRINRALRRNAIIDDSLIDVSVKGHTVFLNGTVDSWYAMQEAEDAAWAAPGVTEVDDRLLIVP
jgi:osmotically-inducible protein OsmY